MWLISVPWKGRGCAACEIKSDGLIPWMYHMRGGEPVYVCSIGCGVSYTDKLINERLRGEAGEIRSKG